MGRLKQVEDDNTYVFINNNDPDEPSVWVDVDSLTIQIIPHDDGVSIAVYDKFDTDNYFGSLFIKYPGEEQ